MLSQQQILTLREHIDKSITIETLRDDLLDHMACAVETKMGAGESFEAATQSALSELAPNGIDEIESETLYLFNQKNIHMKKVLYSFGLVTSICLTMGLMMKLMHMPGGEELVNYGFLGFTLVFVPGLTILQMKKSATSSLSDRLQLSFGLLSATLMAITVSMKMTSNLLAAEILFITGASIFSFGFLPCVFYKLYRKAEMA